MKIQTSLTPIYVPKKLLIDGQKKYSLNSEEVYQTKEAYRRAISLESGGAWIEEKAGKKRHFVDRSSFFQTSHKEVSKIEFYERLYAPTNWQKVLGVGLGILALAPGVSEILRHAPKEAGLALLATQKNSLACLVLGGSFIPALDAQTVEAEFQVNTYVTNNQKTPVVAGLGDGGFMIAWDSTGQDGSLSGIYGQRYRANGAPFGIEFQVNTFTTSHQTVPSIAGLSDGGYLITWYSDGQDGSHNVYAQRYNQTGATSGGEFLVNTYVANSQYAPFAMGFRSGGYLIVWHSNSQDGDLLGIFGQRFSQSGGPINAEFQINTYISSNQDFPSAAELSNGGFVVIWESLNQDGDGDGIYGQMFDQATNSVGSEFRVHTNVVGYQQGASVAALVDGGFLVCWHSSALDGDGYGISAQRFNSTGSKVGTEFLVNTYTTGHQQKANAATLADGKVVVVWQSSGQDGSSDGIFGQRFDSNLTRIGTEFQINTYTSNFQTLPKVGALTDGGFVVTWESTGQDGSGIGVYAKRYDAVGTEVFPPSQTLTSAPFTRESTYPWRTIASIESTSSKTTESSSFSSRGESLNTTVQAAQSSLQVVESITTIRVDRESPSVTSSSTTPISTSSSIGTTEIASQSSHELVGLSMTSGEESEPSSRASSGTIEGTSSSSTLATSSTSIPPLLQIQYGRPYSIVINGETIGSYTINGGSGIFSNSNSNTIEIEIDSSFVLENGATVVLFQVPEGEEATFESVEVLNEPCVTAEGTYVADSAAGGSSFEVLFVLEETSCSIYSSSQKVSAIPMLLLGGLE